MCYCTDDQTADFFTQLLRCRAHAKLFHVNLSFTFLFHVSLSRFFFVKTKAFLLLTLSRSFVPAAVCSCFSPGGGVRAIIANERGAEQVGKNALFPRHVIL